MYVYKMYIIHTYVHILYTLGTVVIRKLQNQRKIKRNSF